MHEAVAGDKQRGLKVGDMAATLGDQRCEVVSTWNQMAWLDRGRAAQGHAGRMITRASWQAFCIREAIVAPLFLFFHHLYIRHGGVYGGID